MSDNIKVVVKVRPLITREIEDDLSFQWRVQNNTIYQIDGSGNLKESGQQYTFDKIYDEKAKTEDVYNDVAKPIVEAAIAGFNGTIFAYGQTSSGKTYTMSGTEESPGIIQLAVLNLFERIKCIPDRDFLVRVSYIEIYNETLKDLLNGDNDKIKIQDTVQGVKITATEKFTSSPEEVLEIMREGEANRQIGATNMNEESSRSHSIFQITIESREHIEGEEISGSVNVSTLNLVDLAGSERSGQTGATGKRFKEGTHINKSLSTLGLVIKQLSEDPNKHANYRDSKLTRILQNSLGGNAKTSIICAVTPAAVDETISTLQFANRAKAVKNKPEIIAVTTNATKLQDLTKQLSKLQSELAIKNHIEQDNRNLMKQIAGLQKMILNGFGQSSVDIGGCRRKTWCAPRRMTIGTLHTVEEEDKEIAVQKFCTPVLKYNPMSLPNTREFQPIRLAPVTEEAIMITPPPIEKKVNFSDEIIDLDSDEDSTCNTSHCSPYHKCYKTSKTPPCVLRKNAKTAEKNLKDIVELTEREKMYNPDVVEYMEKFEQSTITIASLENELKALSEKNLEKDSEVKLLKDKITQTENEVKHFSNAKAELEAKCNEFNTKITDLEVSYETLKMKAKLREDELLSFLNEQTSTKKPRDVSGKSLSRTFEKEFGTLDLSKDISLVSGSDSIIDTSVSGETPPQLQELVTEMKTQMAIKNETILNLESDLRQQKLSIESLENTCKELREQIMQTNSKLECVDEENSLLKSSIETLNSTISSQKQNLEIANNDIQSYTSVIQELQTKLTARNGNVDISDNLLETMIAHEEKVIANNENLRNIIHSFKIALDTRTKEIETLKSAIRLKPSTTFDDELVSEQLQAKEEQINRLVEEVQKSRQLLDENVTAINKLILENENLAKDKRDLSDKLLNAEKENTDLEKSNASLRKENENFTNKLQESNENHSHLLQSLNEFKNNISELQNEKEELSKLKSVVASKDNLIAELKSEILSKDNLINSLSSDHTKSQDYLSMCKSIVTKIQQLFYVLTGDGCVESEIIDDSVAIFTTLYDRLNTVEITAKEMVTQKELAVINSNKLEQEIETLQIQVKTLEEDKKQAEIDKDVLNQQIVQLTNDLENVQIEVQVRDMLKSDLQNALENNQKLTNDITVKERTISNLQNEEIILRLQIEQIIQQQEQSKQEIEDLRLLIDANQIKYDELMQGKEEQIKELKENCNKKETMLDENCIELQKLSKTLDETIRNRDELLENINKAATNLINDLEIENTEAQFSHGSNVYSNIINILNRATNAVVILKSEKSVDNNKTEIEEAKQKLDQLQQHHKTALENLSRLEKENKLLVDEVDEIKINSKIVNSDLLKSNEMLQRLQLELKEKLQIIENLESKINEWKENFATLEESMKQQILELQANNFDLQSQCSQRDTNETYSIEREFSDLDSCQRQSVRKSLTNVLVEPGNASPQSLLTLCCNKITETIQPSETDLKTTTSSSLSANFPTITAETQTDPCDCSKLLAEKDLTLEQNMDLKAQIDFLQYANLNLIKEQEDIRKELKLLVEPAHDLQKKISNHKTNLSTLTATTYAENKLLKSQVKVLQHHNNRFFSVCQRDLPAFKNLLQELNTILKNTSSANRLEANIKRYSLPEVLDKNSSASNFKDESSLDGDLLMLDTNVTLASSDNTILAQDQTCLDGTQIYLDTEINTELIQAIDPNVLHTQLQILSVENQKLTEKLEDLRKENLRLHENVERMTTNTRPDIRKIDAQSSPIKLNNSYTKIDAQSSPIKLTNSLSEFSTENSVQIADKVCGYCRNENTLETHEKMAEQIELLTKELLEIKHQKSDLQKQCSELSADIIANDKLILKVKSLEKDNKAKIIESNQLTQKLATLHKEFKKLQEENDILSTQVMDNIDESDCLKKELDILKQTNSVLTNTCAEQEELIKSTNEQLTNAVTCLFKTRNCLKTGSVTPETTHSSLNRSQSYSESSSRSNKLSTLHNELLAGREDLQTITDDVATIKNHLDRGNLSISHSMVLDDSMGESDNILSKELNADCPKTENNPKAVVPEERLMEIYTLDKIDCINYYVEKTGAENNLSQETKLIDVMQMFYNNLIAKHGNEVENLVNKLKDFEESRNELVDKINHITTEYSKLSEEIKNKDSRINGIANVLSKVRDNINILGKEISGCDVDKNTVLVEMFKDNLLNILDTEFEISSVSIFESLIDKVVSKHQNDLLEIMSRYSELQDNMELLTSELNNVTDNLNQMKCQMSDKEKEYNLLKVQKEKVHEISNAVTLDIVKKDQELSDIVTSGCQTLLELNVFIPSEIDLTSPVTQNVSVLIEKLIKQSKQNDLASQEKHKLQLEVTKSKSVLEEKVQELETLNSQLEKLHELCKNATNELLIKNEALETQNSLHMQLNEVYEKKVEENLANIKIIENLTQEIGVLKDKLDVNENAIHTLQQLKDEQKTDGSEAEARISELMESVNNLEHENRNLKSINEMITNESEQNVLQLAKADDTIKKNKTELDKMTAEILALNKSMKENMSVIDSLKLEAQTLLDHNVALKKQFEEANALCSQLKLNMKTHEKSAEIQCKIINRLKKEKEDTDSLVSEKNKQMEELTKECEALRKDCETLTADADKSRQEANLLKEVKESLERRISELEAMVEGTPKLRSSIGSSDSRRRRQSLLDSKRAFEDKLEPDHKKMEAYFCTGAKAEDMFMDVDDNSNRSTPVRNRRSDSYQSRNEESDQEGGSRPGSALARRRRRQSMHDQHRNTHKQPDHLNTLDENKMNTDHSSEASELKERLQLCQQELEELKERYREVDEECEICAEYLRERDEQCLQLRTENKELKHQITELNDKLQNASLTGNQKESRRTFANASVNTDEDWTNLHAVVVDRMSFDREVEKNKGLQRCVEELRFKNGELKQTLAKAQKSAERAARLKADAKELETLKLELDTCRRELEEYKERCKELDEECETCGEYLRERDEQIHRLKEARDALEAKLEELQEKEKEHKLQSVRKKRQSMHDQNRNSNSALEYRDASTETNEDLLSYQVERDNNSMLQTGEMQQLKVAVERLSQQKTSLELQLRALGAAPLAPLYVATGSAIVQNQHLTDVMKENQKLKKMNAKLITICKKRGKPLGESNRENDDPADMG